MTSFALATSGDGDGEGICAVDMSLANAPGASEGSILAGQATASVLKNELGPTDALPEMTAPVVAVVSIAIVWLTMALLSIAVLVWHSSSSSGTGIGDGRGRSHAEGKKASRFGPDACPSRLEFGRAGPAERGRACKAGGVRMPSPADAADGEQQRSIASMTTRTWDAAPRPERLAGSRRKGRRNRDALQRQPLSQAAQREAPAAAVAASALAPSLATVVLAWPEQMLRAARGTIGSLCAYTVARSRPSPPSTPATNAVTAATAPAPEAAVAPAAAAPAAIAATANVAAASSAACAPCAPCAVPEPTASECVVCLDAPASHAFVPCGHQCVCQSCASLLVECPKCRATAVLCIRVYRE